MQVLKPLVHWARNSRQKYSHWRRLQQSLAASKAVRNSKHHALSTRTVVTLTSYPPRFRHLHLVLQSLLYQSVAVDVVLYVQEDDIKQLPESVFRLVSFGLTVRSAPTLRSYTKLIPALSEFPDKYLLTVDDDVIYPPDLVHTLLSGVVADRSVIVCTRAHRAFTYPSGELAPYNSWPHDVQDDAARSPSANLMATGVGGVLYPPKSLHPQVHDMESAMAICPRADDLWFYWMARRQGSLYRKVGSRMDLLHTPASQATGLWQQNSQGGNDEQIGRLVAEFGVPEGVVILERSDAF